VRVYEKNSLAYFTVNRIEELSVIIAHFDKYPLISQKRSDFELFKSSHKLISHKEHLTKEGLDKLLAIKASINLGLTSNLKDAFPNITPISRPLVEGKIIDPAWLAGFTSGEGCFYISISKAPTTKTGFAVKLWFIIGQHSRDKELISKLVDNLACGRISKLSKGSMVCFVVTKFSDIIEKIIPFFDKYLIQGVKLADYQDFKRVAELMKEKGHLNPEGLAQIRVIKDGMNTGRDSINLPSISDATSTVSKLSVSKSLNTPIKIQKRTLLYIPPVYGGMD